MEVLVALVVMAVGMLGIAALYVEGLRSGRTAIYRTSAISLAADMADRIRANPVGKLDYAANNRGGISTPADICGSGVCDSTERAAQDWSDLQAAIGDRLPPGAEASISVVDEDPTNIRALVQYTITIAWPETGQDGMVDYSLSFQRQGQ